VIAQAIVIYGIPRKEAGTAVVVIPAAVCVIFSKEKD